MTPTPKRVTHEEAELAAERLRAEYGAVMDNSTKTVCAYVEQQKEAGKSRRADVDVVRAWIATVQELMPNDVHRALDRLAEGD